MSAEYSNTAQRFQDSKRHGSGCSSAKYWAFISYSHADEKWARWLHRALERYKVPKRLRSQDENVLPRRLYPIFRDREELASSAELGAEIEGALRQSNKLIVICSPRSARSHWVNQEILYFKRLGREARILSLIVDGEPDDPTSECFAPALKFRLDDEGNLSETRIEPIAADVRPQGDGKSDALLKLVAGLLSVGFEQLRQRDLKIRNRRLSAVAVGAASVAGVTIALAIGADRARDEALRARDEAESISQFLSKDMLESMNVDVRNLRELTMVEWLDHASGNVESRFADKPTVAVKIYQSLAIALSNLGQQPKAFALMDRAVAIARENYATRPKITWTMVESIGGFMTSLVQFKDIEFWETALSGAEAELPEGSRLRLAVEIHLNRALRRFRPDKVNQENSERLLAKVRNRYPNDVELLREAIHFRWRTLNWRREPERAERLLNEYNALETPEQARQLSSIMERSANAGDLYSALEQYDRAEAALRGGLEALRDRSPDDTGEIAGFTYSLARLEVSRADAGLVDPNEAIAMALEELERAKRVFSGRDENTIGPHFLLGKIYSLAGQPKRAERHIRQAMELLGTMREGETDSFQRGRIRLAGSLRAQGRIEEARDVMEQVNLDILLSDSDPHLAQADRAFYEWQRGLLFRDLGKKDQARAAFDQSLADYAAIYGEDNYRTARVRADLASIE